MIHISLSEPDSSDWQAWCSECRAKRDFVVKAFAQGNRPPVTDLYKDVRLKNVYGVDAPPFHGKCAYCESRIANSQPGDVEHFRPHGSVTDIDRRPVIVKSQGTTKNHPGYYWLAYDWRNLLWACADCNRPHRRKTQGVLVGKWDRFPVLEDRYATAPGEEDHEAPLLINPVVDDPRDDLSVDDTGIITTHSERGRVTEKVLGLNAREALIKDRKKAMEDAANYLSLWISSLATGTTAEQTQQLRRVNEFRDGSAPFSLAGRVAIQNRSKLYQPYVDLHADLNESGV